MSVKLAFGVFRRRFSGMSSRRIAQCLSRSCKSMPRCGKRCEVAMMCRNPAGPPERDQRARRIAGIEFARRTLQRGVRRIASPGEVAPHFGESPHQSDGCRARRQRDIEIVPHGDRA